MKTDFFDFDKRKTFPHAEIASADNDYCIGIGGNFSKERLLDAYKKGIFPWYSIKGSIQWYSPHPRCVLYPEEIHISHSMRRLFNHNYFEVTFDHDFPFVINQCASAKRNYGTGGTWITYDFIDGYTKLHEAGYAHSVEVWKDEKIVGGLYGVSIGKCFCGESMFSLQSNASKFGLITLAKKLQQLNFVFIDCQVMNPHLQSLGAKNIDKKIFLAELKKAVRRKTIKGSWEKIMKDV
jgi:leucyl/phenylalanyl-tRNA--protein transferase